MRVVERARPAALLAELKAHLRLEDGREDALLAGWLRHATEAVEAEVGQLLLSRAVEETLTVRSGAARLALAPVRSVEAVEIGTTDGGWVLLGEGDYQLVDDLTGPAQLCFSGVADGSRIRVRYSSGLADSWNGLPELLRQAVIRLGAHFHGCRDSADAPAMPPAVRQMLAPLRLRRLR